MMKILPVAFAVVMSINMTALGQARADGLAIEHATLQCFPDADCTKIKVYLRNAAADPVVIPKVYLDGRCLDCITGGEVSQDAVLDMLSGDVPDPTRGKTQPGWKSARGIGNKPVGALQWLQWHRVLPNPIEPGCLGELTLSLWGAVETAELRIPLKDDQSLTVSLRDEKPALRLSHIAFDPADPNRIYVYCENLTAKAIPVTRVVVHGEAMPVSNVNSIPASDAIEPESKSCFVLRSGAGLRWGRYAGISVFSGDDCMASGMVRVMNHFPIVGWNDDTRPEMFLDATGMVARNLDELPSVRPSPYIGEAYELLSDIQVRNNGEWSASAVQIMRAVSEIQSMERTSACRIGLCNPVEPKNAAFFGGLADVMLMNLYRTRTEDPDENAARLTLARTWMDPRSVGGIQEAFLNPRSWKRELTPREIGYSVWATMGAGAKGVAWYLPATPPPSKGYDNMPGARWAVARTSLDLQLLKSFLRIGDSAPGAASADRNAVRCRTVLCGDAGIVLILLNTLKCFTPNGTESSEVKQRSRSFPRVAFSV